MGIESYTMGEKWVENQSNRQGGRRKRRGKGSMGTTPPSVRYGGTGKFQ